MRQTNMNAPLPLLAACMLWFGCGDGTARPGGSTTKTVTRATATPVTSPQPVTTPPAEQQSQGGGDATTDNATTVATNDDATNDSATNDSATNDSATNDSATNDSATNDSTTDDARSQIIIGGTPYAEYPGIGALTYYGSTYCSATLISPRKVLTAAHCIFGDDVTGIEFAIGPNSYTPEATVPVSSVLPHPGFDGWNVDNDIALVFLAEDAPVEPLAVLPAMDDTWVGQTLLYVGYGIEDPVTYTGDGTKRAVEIGIAEVLDSYIQGGGNGVNACFGDSGGPAVFIDDAGTTFVAAVHSQTSDAYCTDYTLSVRTDIHADFLTRPEPGCQQVSYVGTCDGETLRWCEGDRVHTAQCDEANQQCGWDSQQGFYGCINPLIPCRGETVEGRCEGHAAAFCDAGTAVYVDCEARGATCGYDEAYDWYACTEALDPCQGVPPEGQCDGDTALWCDGTQVHEIPCADYGMLCGETDWGTFDCIPDYSVCGDETPQGRCDGDMLIICDGYAIYEINCADYGAVCEVDSSGHAYCVGFDACDGVPAEGVCNGTELTFCDGQDAHTVDCATASADCTWVDPLVSNWCVSNVVSCEGVVDGTTWCDGDFVYGCFADQALVLDCSALAAGETCADMGDGNHGCTGAVVSTGSPATGTLQLRKALSRAAAE